MREKRVQPLKARVHRVKNSVLDFFCPLCRTERGLRTLPRLSLANYFQIVLTSIVVTIATYNLMGIRSLMWIFFIWGGFEFFRKLRFRREIPCPHCGFDATWYKRDVRLARKVVEDFWSKN